MNETTETRDLTLLSIDAWRGMEGGWDWNEWHRIGTVPATVLNLTPRRLFKYLREAGYLSASSAGRVARDDDGYNVVIVEKNSRRPVYAIEYGREG